MASSQAPSKKRVARKLAPETLERLQAAHPDAHCELDHGSPFQLIVATVLSAQSTDVAVNKATPKLFERWPNPAALAAADLEEVQSALSSIGMYRQKSKNITKLAQRLLDEHGGEVPRTLAELVKLPGVGRKTANVVLGVAFGTPEGVVVDTHVMRISQRLGWTRNTTPEKIEPDLMKLFPQNVWDPVSHTLIFHGRRVCTARKPACAACTITDACPSAFNAEGVGRKPPKPRRAGPESGEKPGKQRAKKKSAAKKAAAKKTNAKRVAAKKVAAKKTATQKTGATKRSPAKAPSAKKLRVRKPAKTSTKRS